MNDDVADIPDEEIWVVSCIKDDTHAHVIGPLLSYEDAVAESQQEDCRNAHAIRRVTFEEFKEIVTQVRIPNLYEKDSPIDQRCYAVWVAAMKPRGIGGIIEVMARRVGEGWS